MKAQNYLIMGLLVVLSTAVILTVTGCNGTGITGTDENKLVVRRFYEAFNTSDVSKLAEFISPDYTEVHNNTKHTIGLAGAREHILGVRKTYPDLHLTIEQQIAEGEWVVTRVTARGTHEGVWLGMKPTGKRVEITAVNIDRVVDGRIVEHGGAANLLEAFLEIGSIRVADPVDG